MGTESDWTSCRYGSADEALHDPAGAPLYNESVYVNFVCEDGTSPGGDPASPVGGIMRIGLRPTDGYAELSLNLPMADGSALFLYDREPLDPAGFSAGSPHWHCGEMDLEVIRPTRRWRLRYAGDRPRHVRDSRRLGIDPGDALRSSARTPVTIDLTFDGRFPLHTLSRSGDITAGGGVAFARNHYEQFGTVTGTITVGDVSFSLQAGGAFRDHSWGPRDWLAAPQTDFCTLLDGDGSAIVCFSAHLDGTDQINGVRWTADGWEPVSAFSVETSYAGEAELHGPLAVVVSSGGRELRYEGRIRSFLPLRHRSGERTVRIGQVLLGFDGPTGPAVGWSDLTRPAR